MHRSVVYRKVGLTPRKLQGLARPGPAAEREYDGTRAATLRHAPPRPSHRVRCPPGARPVLAVLLPRAQRGEAAGALSSLGPRGRGAVDDTSPGEGDSGSV